jgi:tetratricopeptide (TPR) repeat protein
MERLYGHRLTEHAEVLGHHALQGQRWKEAVTYLRLAADKARGRSAHRQAITCLEQALAALAHLPESRDRDAQAVDLRIDLRQSFYLLGDTARNAVVLAEAEHLADALGDASRLGWVALYIGENQRLTGDLADARRCYGRARALAEGVDDAGLRTAAAHYLGIGAHLAGEYRTSVELFREVGHEPRAFEGFRLASGSPGAGHAVNAAWLARSLAVLGEFEEAAVCARGAVAAAEQVGSAYSVLLTTFALGEVQRERGAFAEALPPLERSVAIAREWDIRLMLAQVTSRLGAAYTRAGRIDEGLALLRVASAEVAAESSKTRYPVVMRLLGEAYALVDDVTEARACAERALRVALSLGQRGDEAPARWLLGCTADTAGSAEDAFRGALELGSALGMRPLVAHCHLGLGKLYGRTGNVRQARECLTAATTMYREMAMPFWLEQAEKEMRVLV